MHASHKLAITTLDRHLYQRLPAFLELREFAQACGHGVALHANKRAVLDAPPAQRKSSPLVHAGKSGAGPCTAPTILVGKVGKHLV